MTAPSPLTAEEIEKARKLCERATEGPWEFGAVPGNALTFIIDKMRSIVGAVEAGNANDRWWRVTIPGTEIIIAETGFGPTSEDNARFIFAAHTIVPRALSTLASLTLRNDELEKMLEQYGFRHVQESGGQETLLERLSRGLRWLSEDQTQVVMAALDRAVFADTQAEPVAVYDHLRWLMSPGVLSFPVHIVSKGNLWKSASTVRTTRDGERTYIGTGIPVFTEEGLPLGIGKRQCTRDFKIDPVNRELRRLLGLKRVPHGSGALVEMWMGISTDEYLRMKQSAMPWVKTRWPLIEKGMDRDDCLDWMAKRGYPQPPRSACTFCPFRDDDSWLALSAVELADSVAKERELQAAYESTSEMRGKPFLHDSRKPLGEVTFIPSAPGRKPRQLQLFNNECEGMCGV